MTTKHDPTRTATLQNKAVAEIKRRLKIAFAEVQKYADSITSRAVAVNRTYDFRIDPWQMERIVPDLERKIAEHLAADDWFFSSYIGPAYTRGAMQAAETVQIQMALVLPDIGHAVPAYMTTGFQNRYNLIRAREFELMTGFAGETARDLGGLLSRAILDGLSPDDISKSIADRFGVALYRGERIARTEITTALRRARMDEGEASAERIGLEVKFLHLSAFSPTSRASHIARDGKLYTGEECRLWWSQDGNSINCKCSITEVLIGADGEPLAKGLIDRAKARKKRALQ